MATYRLHAARYVIDVGGARMSPGDFLADVALGDGVTPELLTRAMQSGYVVLEETPHTNEKKQTKKRSTSKAASGIENDDR